MESLGTSLQAKWWMWWKTVKCGGLILSCYPHNPHGKAGKERRKLRGSALQMHIPPCLKSFHFLPAISYWMQNYFAPTQMPAWLCQGYAPTYLKNFIYSCFVSARYSLRINDDNWLLQTVTSLNFAGSQSRFSCALPKVCNSLPLSLLEIETLSLFKKRLQAYYFNLAFEDVTIVWCQYFAAYCCRIITFVVKCNNFISVQLFECYYGLLVRCIDTCWSYLKGYINWNFYYYSITKNNYDYVDVTSKQLL